MVDKKLFWKYESVATAGDQNWVWDVNEIVANSYNPNLTVDSFSGFENVYAGANKLVYFMVARTDGGGSYPFDAITLGAVNTDEELQAFLDAHRDKIWMTLGGLVIASETPRIFEFDASTKRALAQGEKLVLVKGVRNPSGVDTSGTLFCDDMTAFYH